MKKKSITRENEKKDHLDYLQTAVSATDCTGMVYTGLMTEEEIENLNDIYPFEPNSSTINPKG